MLGRLDDYFRPQATALSLRSQRQEVLASNIANNDTPGYKARDFDFKKSFEAALQKNPVKPLQSTDPRHLQPKDSVDPLSKALLYRNPRQSGIDGNTVDMNAEMAAFSDNAIRYQAGITFMQKRIEGMRTALTGQ
jgi:flagellar basal-body rod protein FlgB